MATFFKFNSSASSKSRFAAEEDLHPFSGSPALGLTVAAVTVILGALWSGSLAQLIDIPSLLIVGGGTIGAALVQCSWGEFTRSLKLGVRMSLERHESAQERLHTIMQVCQIIRKEGQLAFERIAASSGDSVFRKACELAADGTPPADIVRIAETEACSTLVPLRRAERIITSMAEYAPGLGLVGTLLGLVQMLGDLENPSAVGGAMGVALLTTLYGAVFSYLMLFPLAARLRDCADAIELRNRLTVEGIARIASNENSVLVEQRLRSYLVNG